MPLPSLRARCVIVATIAVAALAACSDLTKPPATLATFSDTATVWALNGTQSQLPNALILFDGTTSRADSRFGYDVAFDLDATGKVIVIPVRKMAGLGGGHLIDMQLSSGTYASITEAPKSNYVADSIFTISPGTPFVIESSNPTANCSIYGSPFFYSKVVVDSVNKANRQIFVSFTVDPNCGYRSFASGIPTI